MNPQPEPPGNGCTESHSSRPTAGREAGPSVDAGAAADARSDLSTDGRVDDAPNSDDAAADPDVFSEAGTDGAPEGAAPDASSDSDAAVSSDAIGDGGEDAPDGGLEDAGDPQDDGTNDALDVPVNDGP